MIQTGQEAWKALHQRKDFVPHPATAILPAHSADDIEKLAEDITEHGQLHGILLDAHGQVLAGRGRWAACLLAGVEPAFERTELAGIAALDRVVSEEVRRRHMNGVELLAVLLQIEEFRGELRAEVEAPRQRGEDGRWLPREGGPVGKTRERLADMAGCSARAAGQLLALQAEAPERLTEVSRRERSLASAYRALRKEQAPDAEKEADRREWRRTPAWVMHALVDELGPRGNELIWDPFAGKGDLQRAATDRGWNQVRWVLGELRATCHPSLEALGAVLIGGDFFDDHVLEEHRDLLAEVDLVVMNPPFSLALEAVERVWALAPHATVYMLQRRGWVDQARSEWLGQHEPDELKLRRRIRFGRADGEYYDGTDNGLHSWYAWPERDTNNGLHMFLDLPDTYERRSQTETGSENDE